VKEITGYAAVVAGVAAASMVAAEQALAVVAQLWSGMADLPFEVVVPFGR
jgi:hypothetical protein